MQLCLMGRQDDFVISGSDDGWIFIWDRHSGQLVNMLHADERNVSTLAVHPFMPMLASSGSDPVVKLWSPQVRYCTASILQHAFARRVGKSCQFARRELRTMTCFGLLPLARKCR